MATDVPTDPEEYALYMMYGDNWRQFVGERYNTRDRGGMYDYNLHFYNSVPYVALIKNIVDTLQAQTDFVTSMQPPEGIEDYQNQYNIWAEHLVELNRELTDYRGKIENYQFDPKDLEERYAYPQPSSGANFPPPFERPAQPAFSPPFEGNVPVPNMPGWTEWNGVNAMMQVNWVNTKTGERLTVPHAGFNPPSGEGWVKEEFKSEPLDPKKLNRPDATIMGNTGTTTRQPYVIQPAAQQTTAAYLQMAKNNAATAAVASPQERDNSYAAPAPAPAPALPPAKPTMSDQFISRYERAEAMGSDNPKVKTVTPAVKTITKKVKAI